MPLPVLDSPHKGVFTAELRRKAPLAEPGGHHPCGAGFPACPPRYDLNGNPVKRTYPTGVVESRSFDAMNRLLTMSTALPTGEGFAMAYQYDPVGSARRKKEKGSADEF